MGVGMSLMLEEFVRRWKGQKIRAMSSARRPWVQVLLGHLPCDWACYFIL